jgi:hypothetical protein
VSAWEIVRHQVAIAGSVIDAQTSKAIEKAQIEITDGPSEFLDFVAERSKQHGTQWESMVERPDRTRTAPDGHFHFMDLPDGDYTLNASLPGSGSRYGTAENSATVTRDAEGNITMAAVEIPLPPTALKGRIRDQGSNDPIVMAEVRLKGSGERTFTNSEGRYLLVGLEIGKRTAVASARGYQPASKNRLLNQSGQLKNLNFKLTK